MKKSSNHIIEDKIFKILSGNIPEDEKIEFEAWLNANPDNKILFDRYKNLWELTGNFVKNNKNWVRINEKIDSSYKIPDYITTTGKQERFLRFSPWQKVAAAILLLFIIGSLLRILVIVKDTAELVAVHQVNSGILPDGSQVYLNKGSKIEYGTDFNKRKRREVILNGEAFFNISPDKEKPFLIHCFNTTTRVVGTEFNVNPDSLRNEIIVSVAEGIVEFYPQDLYGQKVILHKGEEGRINTFSGEVKKSQIKDQNYNAWKTRELIFEETSLDEVILTLEKYFDITIITENDSINRVNITSKFKNPDLQQVIKEIHLLTGISYKFSYDTLYIR